MDVLSANAIGRLSPWRSRWGWRRSAARHPHLPRQVRLSPLCRAGRKVGTCGPQAKSWRGFLPPHAPTALPSSQGEESPRHPRSSTTASHSPIGRTERSGTRVNTVGRRPSPDHIETRGISEMEAAEFRDVLDLAKPLDHLVQWVPVFAGMTVCNVGFRGQAQLRVDRLSCCAAPKRPS
jgi:hypothetical protein